MNIQIKKLDAFGADWSAAVARLYAFEGWIGGGDDPSHINTAIRNSYCAFGAFDGALMVGFFRALSDGVSDGYLLDLVVDPAYRGCGIGSMLTEAVLAELKKAGLDWVTCIANPGVDKLYGRFGKPMDGFTPMRFR